jgi:hypothetical protein
LPTDNGASATDRLRDIFQLNDLTKLVPMVGS